MYLLFFRASSFTYENEYLERIDFFDNVKKAFDNEVTFQRWFKDRYQKYEVLIDPVKEIVAQLKDILTIIDKRAYRKLKKMVIQSELLFSFTTGFPYLETRILVNCICSILKLKKIYKREGIEKCFDYLFTVYHSENEAEFNINSSSNLQDGGLKALFDKIVFNEYEYIYSYLTRDMINNYKIYSSEDDLDGDRVVCKENNGAKIDVTDAENFLKSFRKPRTKIIGIIKFNNKKTGHVLASKYGLSLSKKCLYKREGNNLHLKQKPLFKKMTFQEINSTYYKHRKLDKDHIKSTYMNDRFIYNLTGTKLLIPLIHFLTMTSRKNAKYKIFLNEEGLYETKWYYENEFFINLG
jgi:hypothetical protein